MGLNQVLISCGLLTSNAIVQLLPIEDAAHFLMGFNVNEWHHLTQRLSSSPPFLWNSCVGSSLGSPESWNSLELLLYGWTCVSGV